MYLLSWFWSTELIRDMDTVNVFCKRVEGIGYFGVQNSIGCLWYFTHYIEIIRETELVPWFSFWAINALENEREELYFCFIISSLFYEKIKR